MAIDVYELEPNKENLLKALEQDLIDRNDSIWRLASFCDAQERNCSIAIDGKWGSGKTFFVKQTKMLIEAFNNNTNAITEDERARIKGAFSRFIENGYNVVEFMPQVCVYYDAWLNDNDTDPVLSLVYEIFKTTATDYPFKKSTECIKAIASIIDAITGKKTSEIVDLFKGNDPLAEIKQQKEIYSLIEGFFDSIRYEQGNRLVIFIDELDRCKPSYAVTLLERIKHYFANDNITFVFSINIEELQHTIKRYYGDGFDACGYLNRFFDYQVQLPPANISKYYRRIGLEDSSHVFESVCKAVINQYNFGLREIEKFYRNAKIAAYVLTHTNNHDPFSDSRGLHFGFVILVPIIIGLRMADKTLHDQFVNGENVQPLIDIIGNGNIGRMLCHGLLNRNETYEATESSNMTVVSLKDKLHLVYQAIFGNSPGHYDNLVTIGEYTFSREMKNNIMQATSIISKHASY